MEKARERGQVARSRDLVSAVTLMAGVLALDLGGPTLATALARVTQVCLSALSGLSPALGGRTLQVLDRLMPALTGLALVMVPFMLLLLGVAVLGVALQTGVPQASWLTVDFGRLNPLARLRQLFSAGHGGWELGKVAAKLVLIGGAAIYQLRPLWREMRRPLMRLRKSGLELRKDGTPAANPQRMGPLTLDARRRALAEVLSIQSEINGAALATGRQCIDILNAEERDRIIELIDKGTWPDGWEGDEPRADVLMEKLFADGTAQPLLLGLEDS